MMPNTNMYVTVKKVNPERLRCPVLGCENEGKEENRVQTPHIQGLGPMTVYLCDIHASALAVLFLDKHAAVDVVQWDEPRELARQLKSMPNPVPGQEFDPMFQAIWQTIKDWDINVPGYYEGYCRATGSHVMLLWNALSQPCEREEKQLPGEAGALFAFMGWLTSRKQVSGPFSSHHEAGQAAQLIRQFVDMQGWPDPPENWHHSIKPFDEDDKEALGRAHMDNYVRARMEPISELEDISYGYAPLEEV
jgi:hypothetical protein